jgi:hypothetical protein
MIVFSGIYKAPTIALVVHGGCGEFSRFGS